MFNLQHLPVYFSIFLYRHCDLTVKFKFILRQQDKDFLFCYKSFYKCLRENTNPNGQQPFLMIANVDLRCYMEFDWLWKNAKPIKFNVT